MGISDQDLNLSVQPLKPGLGLPFPMGESRVEMPARETHLHFHLRDPNPSYWSLLTVLPKPLSWHLSRMNSFLILYCSTLTDSCQN